MAEVLKSWLRTRLGVLMDLTPDIFGRYARDGTMMAHILYSYGIITNDQMSALNSTQDPALARVNLRLVRIWLKVINVALTDDCLNDISKARGAAALHLFYKVYLALEGKDRLHFIALCKEREKFTPISNRFEVVKISEDPPPYQSHDHPLSKPLVKGKDTIRWHENKFWRLSKQYKQQRQQRLKLTEQQRIVEPIEDYIPEEKIPEQITKSEKLDEFARLHPPKKTKRHYHVIECCPGKKALAMSCVRNSAAATEYIDFLKKRTDKAAKSYEMKLKSQTAMMTNAWKQLLNNQERFLDEMLCKRVFDQSRYEKQMIKKMCEVWDLRRRIVENRRLVETMLRDTLENECQYTEDRRQEILKREIENVEMETCRMAELRRKICDEKVHRMRAMYRGICVEILRDLTDFAIKMAQYRQANDSHILHKIWRECRTAFLKRQPIFNDFEEMEKKNTIIEELKIEEEQRLQEAKQDHRKALADMDFENYRDLVAPWDEFVQERDKKVEEVSRLGRIVLGYVVHRLLECLYPLPLEVTVRPLPEVKIAAIILGITNPAVQEQLRELLMVGGVHLLRMEDAINYCLENYKQEMSQIQYIDLDILTAKDVKISRKKSDEIRGDKALKKLEKLKYFDTTEEKETQTPRQIPYDDMDPILSDSACIGKWIYEFLTLGQPISNELNTKIVIEYLKGIKLTKGWALINYPNTYEQMAMLEKALIGYEVPSEPKIDFEDINIEAIDPPSPRIVFKETVDAHFICRQSRLLPNPKISQQKDLMSKPTTYMTIYVKAMPKSKLLNQENFCIPIPEDASSIDEFYVNENIAYRFFYTVLDRATLQQLADLITEEFPTTSLEEEVPQKIPQDKQKPIDPKVAIIKRLVSKFRWGSLQREEEEDKVENHILQPQVETELIDDQRVIKPGEDDWQWLNLPQIPIMLQSMAIFWENMEKAYVENMKEILALKKMHTAAIMPYKEFIIKNLMEYIERPDKRQILLQDFHRAFNDVDEDLRDDMDTKCELYCRVDEFRTELWELCDIQRHESENERKRNLQNQWIPVKAAILVNVFTGMLQVEVDHFVDTMQLLQDYYTTMSQKPMEDWTFSKIVLQHIELEEFGQNNSAVLDNEQQTTPAMTKNTEIETINIFKVEIEELFVDISKELDLKQSSVFNFVLNNIQHVRNCVDSISSTILETLHKEEKSISSKIEKSKGMGDHAVDSPLFKLERRYRDLIEEWRYAVSFEIDRVNQRVDVLHATARLDISFLLNTMRNMFHRIYQHIVERYKREIESVNEMAKVFCFAIEEEKPIQQELLLEGGEFIVKSDVIMFPEDPKKVLIKDVPLPLRFRIVQLGRLLDIFQRIAPCGSISERALIYVLQDLVSCEEEDCYPSSVPCAWRQLRPPDIERLIKKLFGGADMIEWREFIVYALDLPMPTHREILKMLMNFKLQDLESKEEINRDQFHETPLWFLEITLPVEHKDDDDAEFIHERRNYDEIMNAMLLEEARLSKLPFGHLISKRHLLEMNENVIGSDDACLRLMLAKELLCQMYLINRKKIHYTSMLLAFCKDEDPREGLGKAFTLAMGIKVCTDMLEGEKFVEEERERIRKLKLTNFLRQEAIEIVDVIMDRLIDRVEKKISEILRIYEITRPPLKIVELDTEYNENIKPPHLFLPKKHVIIKEPDEEIELVKVEMEEEEEPFLPVISEVMLEDYLKKTVYWLPRDVCLSVLSVCLPRYILQTDFLDCESLREGILRVYDELRDEELTDEKNVVLAYRLVNHSFILKLLAASSAFVSKNMSALLHDILDKNIK